MRTFPPTRPLVVLVYPKVEHEKDYLYFWMPFSLLTIARSILDSGLADVMIFDGNQESTEACSKFLDKHLASACCIGFSIMTGGAQIRHALSMAAEARSRLNCPTLVFGGPHVNVMAEQTARHELVDVVLAGPGQTSMPVLVDSILNHKPLNEVPGLIAVDDSRIIRGPINPPRTGMLGRYPWNLIKVEDYIRNDPTVASHTLNYVSSQGCIYKCQFCYELSYQRKYSAMQPNVLIDDLVDLINLYKINGIKFYDADWFVDIHRAMAFSRQLIARNLSIAWAASINPNDVLRARRMNLDLLKTVAESGCRRLLMGIESGSDRILNEVVRKEITRNQALDVATEIANHGILGAYTFIVGFPDETPEEIEQTYDLIDKIQTLTPKPETRVHLFGPLPGTPLFEQAVKRGFVPPQRLEEWANFDYYDTQTPWTSRDMMLRARGSTRLVKPPNGARKL